MNLPAAVAMIFLAAFLSATAGSWLASLPVRRVARGSHWSVIARAYWTLRGTRSLTLVWILTIAFFSAAQEGIGVQLLLAGMAVAGCLTGFRVAELGLELPRGARPPRLATLPARWLLFPGAPSIFLLIALTIGREFGEYAFIMAGWVLLADVLLVMGGSMMILKATRFLRPAAAEFQQLARGLAEADGAPLRGVLQMDLGAANAFASTWTHELILTDTALTELDHAELASVISHEIGHLKESRAVRWQRMASLPGIAAVGIAPAAMPYQPLVAFGLFAFYFVTARLAARNYQRLEKAADRNAHQAPAEEGTYARALEKIHAAGLIPAALHPRHPYPSLFDRMTDAGVIPDFPDPQLLTGFFPCC